MWHVTISYCWAQGKDHTAFEDAARAVDDVEVFQTTSADAAKAAGLSKEGLVVVKTFEGEQLTSVFSGSMDKDAVRSFVKAEKVGWHFGLLDCICLPAAVDSSFAVNLSLGR